MRLDELKYDVSPGNRWEVNPARAGEYYVWRSPSNEYSIRDRSNSGTASWDDLDPFTAQAVLFELWARRNWRQRLWRRLCDWTS